MRCLTRVVFDEWWANLLLLPRVAPTNPGTTSMDCVHAMTTSGDAPQMPRAIAQRRDCAMQVLLLCDILCDCCTWYNKSTGLKNIISDYY